MTVARRTVLQFMAFALPLVGKPRKVNNNVYRDAY